MSRVRGSVGKVGGVTSLTVVQLAQSNQQPRGGGVGIVWVEAQMHRYVTSEGQRLLLAPVISCAFGAKVMQERNMSCEAQATS